MRSFFDAKSWWKYDIYWLLKSSSLNFSEMGNTVFFWAKYLTERWYLLITEMFFVLNFSEMRIKVFFWAKKLMERLYLLGLFELSIMFKDLGNMDFRAMTSLHFQHLLQHYYINLPNLKTDASLSFPNQCKTFIYLAEGAHLRLLRPLLVPNDHISGL